MNPSNKTIKKFITLIPALLLVIYLAALVQPAAAENDFPQANAWTRSQPSVVWCNDPTSTTTLEVHIVERSDVTTRRLVEQIDFEALYINCITAGACGVQRAAIPIVAPSDRAAIETALHACGQPDPLQARMIRIKNTLSLGEMDISESLARSSTSTRHLTPVGSDFELSFTADSQLIPFHKTQQN